MAKKIYEFTYGAYIGQIHGIIVNDNNTVVAWSGMYGAEKKDSVVVTAETIEEIRNVIKGNQAAFAIKKIEPEGITLDGSYETFYINDGEKTAKIKANNIAFCAGTKNADLVIAMHNEIADILIGQGLDPKYFLLD